MDALSSDIVTVSPPDGGPPATRIEHSLLWASLQYPLTIAELRRLSQYQTFLSARVWLHDQGLPCSKMAAKRLAFGRFLVTSGRVSEARS